VSQLSVRDLVIRYGAHVAVKGLSFEVEEGAFVSLLGPSGCGKTTTLRCIAGLETASSGEIRIGDTVVASDGREVPPNRRGINMVFQSYAVWPHMTVFDNVAYGLRTRREPKAEVARKVEEILRLVGLSGYAERFGTELSGGQQQRVAVARAVVTTPTLLLFDEPLSNLDAGLRERMRLELVELQRRLGRTSIYVTHDQSEAMMMSDHIILMHDGLIVQAGPPRDLYDRPASRFAAEFVGNANLHPALRVEPHGTGAATITLGDGVVLNIALPAGRPIPPKPLVCIRPENVVLAAASDAGDNLLSARVERASFVGPNLDCDLAIGPVSLRATFPSRTRLAAGDAITVRVAPESIVLVADDA
jgi:ABC-type Fe3+/spermidine/putrescine transport system ATPase subunit